MSKVDIPLISVITVSFNAKTTIEATILSVISQSYANMEYVIIDGGSTDGTVDIIKKYENKISYWVSEPDKGIYDAMNKGIFCSKGDFVYFLGADDTLVSDVMQKIYIHLEVNTITYGNVYMTHRKRIYDGQFNSWMLITRNIPHQAAFYPRRVFDLYKYELKYVYLADYYLNLLCWKNEHFCFHYMPIVVAVYNDNSSSSNIEDSNFVRDRYKILFATLPYYCFPYIGLKMLLKKIKKMICG